MSYSQEKVKEELKTPRLKHNKMLIIIQQDIHNIMQQSLMCYICDRAWDTDLLMGV